MAKSSSAARKKPRRSKNQMAADIERKYVGRIGLIFEKVQHEVSRMEDELCDVYRCTQGMLQAHCREFLDLDMACGTFCDRLTIFEDDVAARAARPDRGKGR